MKVKLFIAILGLVFASISPAEQGTASGKFVLDGKTYSIGHAYAKTDENAFDDKKKDIIVLLTDQPVKMEDFDSSRLNQLATEGKIHGILVSLNEEKEPYFMYILGVAQVSGNNLATLEPKSFSVQEIDARIFTPGVKDFMDHKYEFDVSFKTAVNDVVAAKPAEGTGTPLPAGGGDPGKAFMAFDKAIQTGDVAALKKLSADERMAKEIDTPDGKEMLKMIQTMRASDVKILKGFVSGDRATLHVQGKDPMEGKQITGEVSMMKVNSEWRVEKESWKMQ